MARKGQERRRAPRVSLSAAVQVMGSRTTSGSMRELSRGGCFVQLPLPLFPVGQELVLRFALPGLAAGEALGEVRYHYAYAPEVGGPGLGLRFLRVDRAVEQAIAAYVATHFAG